MEYREQIIALARGQPLLPVQVAQALATTSILAGAMLSEMTGKGILKVSSLKVGGSPLYFLPGNEGQLLKYMESLNEKDRRTVLKLKEEKLIREQTTDPLTRVSLKSISDFAQPLTVQYGDKQETFWKWFELSDEEAKERIREQIDPTYKKKEIKKPKVEKQKKLEPKSSEEEIEKVKPTKSVEATGEFWENIRKYLASNKIGLVDHTAVKKKTEFDLTIEVPSPVGNLTYYCKARSKKRISDADISAAYVQGQLKKLPVILLIDGELTKKAQEVLSQLKGITVKKV